MWVRLKVIKQIPVQGRPTPHYPGEWVEVGKQLAKKWLLVGDADRPDMPDIKAFPGAGVIVKGSAGQAAAMFTGLEIAEGERPELAFRLTMFWDTSVKFQPENLAAGFKMLERWEVAVPLLDYSTLARDIGTEEERARSEAVIRDLRVLVYDPRLIFLRRGEGAERLLRAWRAEAGEPRLAFLRALYQTKPLVQALPADWIQ